MEKLLMRRAMRTGLLSALAIGTGTMAAHAADPPLAPGRDPGGSAVAVIASGFDYTRAALAAVLARDGEGEAIAWDTLDDDRRPYAAHETGTDLALTAARHGSVRIVPVRADMKDASSLAKAIAFAATTPARIVLVALETDQRPALAVVIAAAKRFETVAFVASLPGPTAEEKKVTDAVSNLMLLDSSGRPNAAGAVVATALGCAHADLAGGSEAEMKRNLLERLEEPATTCEQGAAKPQ